MSRFLQELPNLQESINYFSIKPGAQKTNPYENYTNGRIVGGLVALHNTL